MNMKKLGALFTLFLCLYGPSLHAQNQAVSMGLGIGMASGTAVSEIGGNLNYADGTNEDTQSPIRKLEIPLNYLVATVNTDIEIGNRLSLGFAVRKNLNDSGDKVGDSEYGEYYQSGYQWANYSDSLDTYTEGHNDIDSLAADLSMKVKIYKETGLAVFAGAGYMRQTLDDEIKDLYQYYPSYSQYHSRGASISGRDQNGFADGKVATFESTNNIPYVLLGFTTMYLGFGMDLTFGYSPAVFSETEYHQLLESIEYDAKSRGYALLSSVNGHYSYSEKVFMGFRIDYSWVKTGGDADEYDNGVFRLTTDQKDICKQFTTVVSIGYAF